MVSRKGPEWLPPGFTEKLRVRNGRKIKYYRNMATGKEFYSKKDVINCAKTEEICSGSRRRTVNKDSVSPDDNIGSTSTKENDSTEWLPNGWIMEERPKKGTSKKSYKVYINRADGKKYFSKKSVVEYLNTVQRTSNTAKHIKDDTVVQSSSTPDASRQRKSITRSGCTPQENKNGNNDQSLNTVAIEGPSSDWLPPGWKEEIKMLKNKMRKYYIDPASGYVFYSKADVDRYLKSNDISRCVVRPKKREVDGEALMQKETPQDNVRQTRLRKYMSEHHVTELSTPNENKEGNDKQEMVCKEGNDKQEMVASEDELPPGWTKEIKIKKSGSRIRKDPLYTDPLSGYQFHSKKDAFRYLKTNDIRSCRTRPTKKKLDDQEFVNNETTAGLEKNGNYTGRSFQHDKKQESSLNQDASQEHLMVSSGCTPEWNKNHEGEHSLKKVSITGASVDGLPPGWRKDIKTSQSGTKIRKDPLYTDPVSGYQFHSKKDALRYLETNEIRSCRGRPTKKKLDDQELIKNQITRDNKEESSLNQDASPVMNKNHETEQPLEKVSILGSSEDDLPAGWRKDIKTSFSGTKIRKDPYYTHPDVGYIFRSKNDVFRYLRSGDIKSCFTRPKKREFIDLNLMNETPQEDVNESSLKQGASDIHKPTTSSGCTNKEGDEKDASKMVASQSPLADGLPEGWITEIKKNKNGSNRKIYINPSTGSKFYSKAEIARYLRRIESSSTTTEQNKSSSAVDKLSENSETKKQLSVGWKSNDGINTSFEREVSVMSEDIDINNQPTSLSTEQKLPESGTPTPKTQRGRPRKSNRRASQDLTEQKLPESGTHKTQLGSRKSKKRGSPELPRRTSKRLSASKVDLSPNTLLSESAEDKKSTDAEAINIKSSSSHPKIVADGVPQPSPIEQVKEVANHTPLGNEILQETGPSNEHEKLVTNDNAVTEEQRQPRGNATENKENENLRPQDSQFFYPFGESWSDPCLEFAYKTLTGELPVEDNLEFPGGFPQQVEIPYSQTNACSLPPDVPTIFQNEVPTLPPSSVQQVAPPYNQTSGCPQQSDAPSIFRNDVRPPPPPLQQHNPSLSSPMVFPQQNSSLSSPMPFPQHNPSLSSPVSFSFPPPSGVSGQQPRTGGG